MLLLSLAHAATLNVGPTATYTTINAAIDAAVSGDTILVAPGTYTEDISFDGKTLTLQGSGGPAVTNIIASTTIGLGGSTITGFRLDPSPPTGLTINGNGVAREVEIYGPTSYGVSITGGNPTVEEVAVFDAGLHAYIVSGGGPTMRRIVSYHQAQVGVALKSSTAVTVENCVVIGGTNGVRSETVTNNVRNCTILESTSGAILAITDVSVTNTVLAENTVAVKCTSTSAEATFPNGLVWETRTVSGCASDPLGATINEDPSFAFWSSTADFNDLDFSPASGSPMIDAGTGTDATGGTADLGAFGGTSSGWNDKDNDGQPVLFDCNDHNNMVYSGAVEYDDDLDNDCNGIIEDTVPIDPGGDSGDSEPVGPGDTGDSEPIDPGTVDLDGDGWTAAVDCSEHNIATYPGATEIADTADNDCDGAVDEGTAMMDDDGDGYSELSGDCNDLVFEIHPGATDIRDRVDQDCDGLDSNPNNTDDDGDGQTDTTDCNDADATVYVGAPDPLDGVDNDCDGFTDDDVVNVDSDGDGVTPARGDCNDRNSSIYRGAIDIPDNFIDEDCSGEDNYDVDRDGDASQVSGGTDCDDNNSLVTPGTAERCDGIDNDCDGVVDNDCTEVTVGALVTGRDCGCDGGGAAGLLAVGLASLLIRRRR